MMRKAAVEWLENTGTFSPMARHIMRSYNNLMSRNRDLKERIAALASDACTCMPEEADTPCKPCLLSDLTNKKWNER